MRPILVTTSCDKETEGHNIAVQVLEKRLAACVQISAPVRSCYWWDNKITTDTEYLVVMKSEHSLFTELAKTIKLMHSYEVPEIVATDIVEIDDAYAQWLKEELRNGKR